ncbi:Kinesin protein 1B [Chamberlinius hualienensis]
MSKSLFSTPKSKCLDNSSLQKAGNGTKSSTKTPECFKPISIGTPLSIHTPQQQQQQQLMKKINGKESLILLNDENNISEENARLKVAIRIRPLVSNELADPKSKVALSVEDNTICVDHHGESRSSIQLHKFTFDYCFWSLDVKHPQYADQFSVYQTVAKPLLQSAFEGYNTCLFAYGQTGSGKSFSIMGSRCDEGIIPRFGRELFEIINSDNEERWCVEISYFEIYNEKIHDLLACSPENAKKAAMRVREHPILGPYVEGLATFVVSCYEDFANWLSLGNKQRATAATGLNEKSSRSHSALTVVLTRKATEATAEKTEENTRKSKINIIDLAGSERVGIHGTDENRVKEGVSINKSLLTLGKVISQLAEALSSKKSFVPYRESVLTWLLKESLGGNSKTTMLATVSPSTIHLEETLSTLRYAKQARNIVNVARVNEDAHVRLIRELRAEIEMLRRHHDLSTVVENKILKEKLQESENLLRQALKTNDEKIAQARKCQEEEAERLQKAGIAFQVNNQLPRLVNLNQDPQLTETLNFMLENGETCVGQLTQSQQKNVIKLNGSFIEDKHCVIKNQRGGVFVVPCEKAQTYINGHQIITETKLLHGDRLILGGQHYFRFIDPTEKENKSNHKDVEDYFYAQNEFLKIQDERIKEDLAKEREKIRQEMLEEIGSIKKECQSIISGQRHDFENQIEKLSSALDEKHQELEEAQKVKNELDQANMRLMDVSVTRKLGEETILEDGCELEPYNINFLSKFEDCLKSDKIVKTTANSGIGLYKLTTMLKEANQISKQLGLNLVFSHQDRLLENMSFESVVKVKDPIKLKKLEWDIAKFVKKLDILRQLDSSHLADLFDIEDIWEEDDESGITFSPKIVDAFIAAYETAGNMSLNISEVFGSPNGSKFGRRGLVWNKVQTQVKELSFSSKSPSHNKRPDEWYINHSSTIIGCFQAITNSVSSGVEFEYLLKELLFLHNSLNDFNNLSSNMSQAYEWVKTLSNCTTIMLLATTKIITLLSLRGSNNEKGGTSRNLVQKLKQTVEELCNSVSTVMQEIFNGQATSERTTTIKKLILRCCLLSGRIVASLGICVSEDTIINGELRQHFTDGLKTISLNALHTAVQELEDLDLNFTVKLENSYKDISKTDHNIVTEWHKILNLIKEWTGNFERLQEITRKENQMQKDVINFTSANSRQIILNFCALIDNVNIISEHFFLHLEKSDGEKMQDFVSVSASIDEIGKNMNLLMSDEFVGSALGEIEEDQKQLEKDLKKIQSKINNFKIKLNSLNLSLTCSKSCSLLQQAISKSKQIGKYSENHKSPKKGNNSSVINSNGELLHHRSPLSNTGTGPESVSFSSTSIWTTKSTLFDPEILENTLEEADK